MTTTSSVAIAQVPTVDFSPFLRDEGIVVGDPPTAEQLEVARQIDDSCRGSAFLHIVNFGLTRELRDAAFLESKHLFDLKQDHKESQLRRIHPTTNTGYSPLFSENINRSQRSHPEAKEAFNVRWEQQEGDGTNDFTGCPPDFSPMAEALQACLQRAAHRYAMACALALGLPTEFFSQSLAQMNLCTLRFLHYPPYDEYNDQEPMPARIGEHTDFGIFTFLLLGDTGPEGLQIKPVLGGDTTETGSEGWFDVKLSENDNHNNSVGTIVNTGALMARWINDEWRATAHRVLIQNKQQASRSRYSIACFVDPDKSHMVSVHDRFTHHGTVAKKYEPITSSDYLMQKLQSMMNQKADVK